MVAGPGGSPHRWRDGVGRQTREVHHYHSRPSRRCRSGWVCRALTPDPNALTFRRLLNPNGYGCRERSFTWALLPTGHERRWVYVRPQKPRRP